MSEDEGLMSRERQAEFVRLLLGYAGVKETGAFGPYLAAALVQKLGLARVEFGEGLAPEVPACKVAIDAGHGTGNRVADKFDPGVEWDGLREADVALDWALELRRALDAVKVPVWMTRETTAEDAALARRVRRAMGAGCTHLVSFHLNDAEDSEDSEMGGWCGMEVLYSDAADLARTVYQAVAPCLRTRGLGVRCSPATRVLKFEGRAVVVNLGFIGSAVDRRAFLDEQVRRTACGALAWALKRDGMGDV